MISDSPNTAALTNLLARGGVAVLTGAGVSTDSGLPDYRGAGSPPRTPMSIEQFTQDLDYRRRFWAGAALSQAHYRAVRPNAGHRALARLEAAGFVTGVITQNVDGLHRAAGTRTVVELHGAGSRIVCTRCREHFTRDEVIERFNLLNPGYVAAHADAVIAPDGDAIATEYEDLALPDCPVCGGMVRPDVVYFGEVVPAPVFAQARAMVDDARALLVLGSSLAVNTGVRLVNRAVARELPVAVVNRGRTAADARAALRLDAGASEVMAQVAERLIAW